MDEEIGPAFHLKHPHPGISEKWQSLEDLASFILEWIVAHIGKPVSSCFLPLWRVFLVSNWLSRDQQRKFLSAFCGTWKWLDKTIFTMVLFIKRCCLWSLWVIGGWHVFLLQVSGVRKGQQPSLRIPCPSPMFQSTPGDKWQAWRGWLGNSNFSRTPCFFFPQKGKSSGSNASCWCTVFPDGELLWVITLEAPQWCHTYGNWSSYLLGCISPSADILLLQIKQHSSEMLLGLWLYFLWLVKNLKSHFHDNHT